MLESFFYFFEQNQLLLLEIIGAFLTLWCVYLAAINNIINWPVSMLASVVYFFIFYMNRFFSDAYLQIIFLLFQTYGWWFWSKYNRFKTVKSISNISKRQLLLLVLIATISYLIWYSIYTKINLTARYPSIDSLCTIISLTALYMQAKHWIENWIVWIIVDLIYVPLYILGNQKITAILYLFLIFLAFKGYTDWKKMAKTSQTDD